MKDYNGFSAQFRQKQYDKKKVLIASGEMEDWSKQPCEICGLEPKRGSLIMGHCEDYNDLYDNHAVCVECHMKLHRRFKSPLIWINHLIAVQNGYVSKGYPHAGIYFKAAEAGRVQIHDYTDDITMATSDLGDEWYHKIF